MTQIPKTVWRQPEGRGGRGGVGEGKAKGRNGDICISVNKKREK